MQGARSKRFAFSVQALHNRGVGDTMQNRDKHIAPSVLYMKLRQASWPCRSVQINDAAGALAQRRL